MRAFVKPLMVLGMTGALALGAMTPSEARSGRGWAAAGIGLAAGAIIAGAAANAAANSYYGGYGYYDGGYYGGYGPAYFSGYGPGYGAYAYEPAYAAPVYSAPAYDAYAYQPTYIAPSYGYGAYYGGGSYNNYPEQTRQRVLGGHDY